ncbi:MAG TPA: bifunctional tetrahydrofolate synthase/dihydrofolate synthase [Burkholderiales bacterium]|nr:bifunctional tetrahydrofolate synthase/dihydrofolate synthase [Burkholderiales bacterium]
MKTLEQWLAYVEQQHPQEIALGLDRVKAVMERLQIRLECPVVTVGGTNGKGSTCAMLEATARAAGYRTALYTSPHLLRYNERVRLRGREADDAPLCEAFAAVEAARGTVALTYFEFGTLAALWLFAQEKPEVVVLEVGLGGRLDAVNVVDPDCAVLTSIAIDHVDYLGSTRESIASEKAGIFRPGRPAVVAVPDPPAVILESAARLFLLGRDFGYAARGSQWSYWGPAGRRSGLAHPALRGARQLRNAAAALCALDSLRMRLPIAMQDVRRGLAEVAIPGRFQVVPGRPEVILDVAHNVEAARALADNLGASRFAPNTIAVCGMLQDKDIPGVLGALAPRITRWHLCSLPGSRGASAEKLFDALRALDAAAAASQHASPAAALAAALEGAGQDDKIVVFGSFLTVGEASAWLNNNKTSMR